MDKLQIIYTTENGQFCANLPYSEHAMRNKKSFITFALAALYGKFCFLPTTWKLDITTSNSFHIPEDMPELPIVVKLSACVIVKGNEEPSLPVWYNACHGKVYKEDLEQFNNLLTA